MSRPALAYYGIFSHTRLLRGRILIGPFETHESSIATEFAVGVQTTDKNRPTTRTKLWHAPLLSETMGQTPNS
jgi:hypothetical protein